MRTKIAKWGNSLGLRIPKSFAEDIRIADGSEVELSLEGGNLVVRAVAPSSRMLDNLLAQVTDDNLPGEIDTGDAVGGEEW
jgi:antitoxin MazE